VNSPPLAHRPASLTSKFQTQNDSTPKREEDLAFPLVFPLVLATKKASSDDEVMLSFFSSPAMARLQIGFALNTSMNAQSFFSCPSCLVV